MELGLCKKNFRYNFDKYGKMQQEAPAIVILGKDFRIITLLSARNSLQLFRVRKTI